MDATRALLSEYLCVVDGCFKIAVVNYNLSDEANHGGIDPLILHYIPALNGLSVIHADP